MNSQNFIAFKSSLMFGKDDNLLRKSLKKDQIERAIKESKIEMRNKKFKVKDF